ncbi:MAG: serine/threonine protein kinase [Pirellula sp.]|nr:serine/threonine protein kinase [Pirellula sp.]
MELEEILTKVLEIQVDEHATLQIHRLISENPRWAEEITECWELHRQMSCSKSSDSTRFLSDWDSYEILDEVDRGGMGIVYRAKHKELNRIVALKIIRSGEFANGNEIARFRREAQIAAQLVHPGIVPIYEIGERNNLIYYTMAFVEGCPLLELARSPTLSIAAKVQLVYQLTQALQYAHGQGVAHRDIKPSNILIDLHGSPILIDFGLAKSTHAESDLTQTGAMLGTPSYMAPEQIQYHHDHDLRLSDIYSLGAVFYCLLVGRPPFVGPTNFDIMLQLKDRQPVRPSRLNRQVDRELDTICLRAMEKIPSERYTTAAEFGQDLERWINGSAVSSPTKSPWIRWIRWWKQEPGLVSHAVAICVVILVVLMSHLLGYSLAHLPTQLTVLLTWLLICFPLQRWILQSKDTTVPAILWGLIDLFCVSWLIATAGPPRSLLLVAYPLMITASALFYRTRFVILMTTACILAFLVLTGLIEDPSFERASFRILFVCFLGIQCLTLTSLIFKVRNLFTYRER